ncbi:hypothetical protein GCM10011506_16660 [Marivirga lumbricoides]|jgi:hypothetical protein|uniref:Phage protein n=1 Tax=Marivirga lumbricoides TaxID=1046115 RepID=A0ABQ1LZI4_9BACT|nr:hypothetical protein GCM10011506_16660 [Marivirga lumbricoides]
MASLQEQIDFMQKEHDRCKLVYDFLLKEFGEKNISILDEEVSEKIHFAQAIIFSLKELQTFKMSAHGKAK